jgi:hypothetical protein
VKPALAALFISIVGVVCYFTLYHTPHEQMAWSSSGTIAVTGKLLEAGAEVYYLSARDNKDMARAYNLPTTLFVKQAQRLGVKDGQVFIPMHISGMQRGSKGTSMQSFGGVLAIVKGSEETRARIELANLNILKTRTIDLPNPRIEADAATPSEGDASETE